MPAGCLADLRLLDLDGDLTAVAVGAVVLLDEAEKLIALGIGEWLLVRAVSSLHAAHGGLSAVLG
jgi:hypothetical protein